jgi:hypothetical protein
MKMYAEIMVRQGVTCSQELSTIGVVAAAEPR